MARPPDTTEIGPGKEDLKQVAPQLQPKDGSSAVVYGKDRKDNSEDCVLDDDVDDENIDVEVDMLNNDYGGDIEVSEGEGIKSGTMAFTSCQDMSSSRTLDKTKSICRSPGFYQQAIKQDPSDFTDDRKLLVDPSASQYLSQQESKTKTWKWLESCDSKRAHKSKYTVKQQVTVNENWSSSKDETYSDLPTRNSKLTQDDDAPPTDLGTEQDETERKLSNVCEKDALCFHSDERKASVTGGLETHLCQHGKGFITRPILHYGLGYPPIWSATPHFPLPSSSIYSSPCPLASGPSRESQLYFPLRNFSPRVGEESSSQPVVKTDTAPRNSYIDMAFKFGHFPITQYLGTNHPASVTAEMASNAPTVVYPVQRNSHLLDHQNHLPEMSLRNPDVSLSPSLLDLHGHHLKGFGEPRASRDPNFILQLQPEQCDRPLLFYQNHGHQQTVSQSIHQHHHFHHHYYRHQLLLAAHAISRKSAIQAPPLLQLPTSSFPYSPPFLFPSSLPNTQQSLPSLASHRPLLSAPQKMSEAATQMLQKMSGQQGRADFMTESYKMSGVDNSSVGAREHIRESNSC